MIASRREPDAPSRRWAVTAGVCAGLALLTKGPALILLPAVGLLLGVALALPLGQAQILVAFAAFHARYHMTRRMQVYVANSELRSLEPENRAVIVGLRRDYERRLEAILAEGRDAGVFRVADLRVTTFALISMMTGICEWYRPEGRMRQDELVALHVDLVLRAVSL